LVAHLGQFVGLVMFLCINVAEMAKHKRTNSCFSYQFDYV
jgi:hypothetical protein